MNHPEQRPSLVAGAALCLFCLSSLGWAQGASEGEDAIRVLVVTGGHDFDPEFFRLFEGHADIVFEKVAHPDAFREFSQERSGNYDVILLYDLYHGKATETRVRKDFVSLLQEGKGLVVLHHALASYGDWPEFSRIVGGQYLLEPRKGEGGETLARSGYRHGVRYRVQIADPAHPIARGLEDFDILDETYKDFPVDRDVDPLLRTEHPTSGPVIGWSKEYLQSRIVCLQPGHGPTVFQQPSYRELVARSIRWVDRRLPDRGLERSWRKLFNGKDLSGWKASGNARWEIRNGVLVGRQGPGGSAGDLFSVEEFGDFDLRVIYRVSWPANSGVWFRYRSSEQAYQADILEWKKPRCWSGTIYCAGKMFIAMNTDETTVRRDGWNTLRVRARGDRIAVDLNGRRVAEARDSSSTRGRFGIQVHAGESFARMKIEVLEVRVAPHGHPVDD